MKPKRKPNNPHPYEPSKKSYLVLTDLGKRNRRDFYARWYHEIHRLEATNKESQ